MLPLKWAFRGVSVSGGQLHLHGVRNDDAKKDKRHMLTGGVTTQGRFAMKYGKVDMETLPVSMHVDWVKFYEGSARGVKFSEFVKPGAN